MSEHATIVEKASCGDAIAVESLLERHLPRLRAFIRARSDNALRERESCSDLVQSVCREVLQGMNQFEYRGETAFRHWLFSKALSKIQDRHRYYLAQKRDVRREQKKPSFAQDTLVTEYGACFNTPSLIAMKVELMESIERAFDHLPDNYREAVTLSKFVGLSNAEIAAELGCDEKAVRNTLHRGLRRLSFLLSGEKRKSEER